VAGVRILRTTVVKAVKRRLVYVVNDRASFVARRMAIACAAHAAGFDVHAILPGPEIGAAAHSVRFTDLGAGETEASLASGPVTVHNIPLSRRGTALAGEWRTLRAIGDVLNRLHPDVVHQFTLKPILYGTLSRLWRRPPALINSFVGLGYLLEGAGVIAAARRRVVLGGYGAMARRTGAWSVFQNPDNLRAVMTQGALDPSRVVLIRGSGVDLASFPFRAEPVTDRPLVVLPARMLADKGINEFVAAARALRAQGVSARFALVGGADPGNPAAIPEDTLRTWHAEGAVEWWGHRGDMPEVFFQAAVVCLPSYAEGVPRSLLEAAATGRAIVTSDVPGCREVVRSGVNGLLVPPRDFAALSRALTVILGDSAARASMGVAGRAKVQDEFSLTEVISGTLALYDRSLANGRVSRASSSNSL